MKAIVSEKGQVTIPKRLRDRLGIKPGQTLEFEAQRGKLVARKAEAVDPVDAAFGVFQSDEATDDFIDRIRGAAE
jgi:AbrB family looped-hinge helix DNA binding protein